MTVPLASFLDTYPNIVKDMKLTLLTYIKSLWTKKGHPDIPFGIGQYQSQPKIILEKTPNGYPIIPIPLQSPRFNKRDWEDLFTMYMSSHYSEVENFNQV